MQSATAGTQATFSRPPHGHPDLAGSPAGAERQRPLWEGRTKRLNTTLCKVYTSAVGARPSKERAGTSALAHLPARLAFSEHLGDATFAHLGSIQGRRSLPPGGTPGVPGSGVGGARGKDTASSLWLLFALCQIKNGLISGIALHGR